MTPPKHNWLWTFRYPILATIGTVVFVYVNMTADAPLQGPRLFMTYIWIWVIGVIAVQVWWHSTFRNVPHRKVHSLWLVILAMVCFGFAYIRLP